MRVALVHDYLKEIGGAEKVLEALSDLFPDAPIYTSLYSPKFFGPHQSRLEKKWGARIKTGFFQHLPLKDKLISPLRLLSPFLFRQFNFQNYDLIITSATGGYFPNALQKKQAKLICYCHTPPRYLYGYATARNITNPILVFVSDLANHFLRLADYTFAQNVDQFIANSEEVKSRIQKFYRRDAVVIYPPILPPERLKSKTISRQPFYLVGGRLARAKRFDLAIAACLKLNCHLKIFGRDFAGYFEELKRLSANSPLIEFLGEISESQRNQLYSQARAFILPAKDEDFGMTAPEAMSYGCPVIAHNSGGPKETVTDGISGVLFADHSVSGLVSAIKRFEKLKFSQSAIIKASQPFYLENFFKKIEKITSLG